MHLNNSFAGRTDVLLLGVEVVIKRGRDMALKIEQNDNEIRAQMSFTLF